MTRSLAKRSAAGGTIDKPGGGLFLIEAAGVLEVVAVAGSLVFPVSGPSPRADLRSRA